MPTYEYRCQACDERFSKRRSIDERDTGIICPNCSDEHVRRLLSTFSAYSRSESGSVQSLQSSSCSGCASTGGCAGCGMSHA